MEDIFRSTKDSILQHLNDSKTLLILTLEMSNQIKEEAVREMAKHQIITQTGVKSNNYHIRIVVNKKISILYNVNNRIVHLIHQIALLIQCVIQLT